MKSRGPGVTTSRDQGEMGAGEDEGRDSSGVRTREGTGTGKATG